MPTLMEQLKDRGLVAQQTDPIIGDLLERKKITFYIGFDATATSLHIGSLLPIITMMHFQKMGHIPVVIVGGGTTMVGDPSGKTEMRKMLSEADIAKNTEHIAAQLSRFIDFSEGKGYLVNNLDWLSNLKYIDFLRDIGRHFSVNRMLSMEAYKQRMEKGLSFIEFNYQLLQAYDFLKLFQDRNCLLQVGGDDQWGNMVAGIDLIRRIEGKEAYAMTLPLLLTSTGEKMGKTAGGAVWLESSLMSPYDFYQYWINCDDVDVKKLLYYFTFLEGSVIEELTSKSGADLRSAKQRLAFEITKLVHGEQEATKAVEAAKALFSGGGDSENIPATSIEASRLEAGIQICDILVEAGLCKSKGFARRLISQGGVYVNRDRLDSHEKILTSNDLEDGCILLRTGKKKYHKITTS